MTSKSLTTTGRNAKPNYPRPEITNSLLAAYADLDLDEHGRSRGQRRPGPYHELPEVVRRDLEIRVDELRLCLDSRAPQLMFEPLIALFLAFGRGADDAQLAVYVDSLSDLPQWAVAAGCADLKRRRTGDWMPTTAIVRAAADSVLEFWVRERAKIEAVLDAKPSLWESQAPPTVEEVAHSAAGRAAFADKIVADFKASLTSAKPEAMAAAREAAKEEAARRSREAWARSVLAEGGDPNAGEIPVSPALERLVRERTG